MAGLELKLFGSVAWNADGVTHTVRGARRCDLLVLLARNRGQVVPVSRILETLWAQVPQSGANAVQRLVRELRSQIDSAGHDGSQIIQTVPSGYCLSPRVRIDIDDESSPLTGEPLVGCSAEVHSAYRQTLTDLRQQRVRAVAVATGEPTANPGLLDMTLSEAAGLWAAGRLDQALDLLDDTSPCLPEDFRRRLYRWVQWLPVGDPGAVSLWGSAAQHRQIPLHGERAVVSLDAYALNQMADGAEVAEDEARQAEPGWQRVRSLRVWFLFTLAFPWKPSDDRIIEALEETGHPDGLVEGARFRFVTECRRGRWCEAVEALSRYEAVVAEQNGAGFDDFGMMVRATFSRAAKVDLSPYFGPHRALLPKGFLDAEAVAVADACGQLLGTGTTVDPLTVDAAVNVASSPAGAGLRILHSLRVGGDPTELVTSWRDILATHPRDKQFMVLVVALARWAIATSDAPTARLAAAALEPWRGQIMGLWPGDAIIGPPEPILEDLDPLVSLPAGPTEGDTGCPRY